MSTSSLGAQDEHGAESIRAIVGHQDADSAYSKGSKLAPEDAIMSEAIG